MTCVNGIVPYINISKICRICLSESENMKSIFSKLDTCDVLEANVYSLSEILTRTTSLPVEESDNFPSLICTSCITLLHGAYKFKVQFDHSHSVLQQYISGYVKQEAQLNFYDYLKNDNDLDYHSSSSNIVETEAVGQRQTRGRRSTSRTQIEKRAANRRANIKEGKQYRRRGRKAKSRVKFEENNLLESENEDGKESKSICHPCPICTKEFPAVELRQHAHSHKALKKYISIPVKEKVHPDTKFYVKTGTLKHRVSLHNRKEKLHACVSCGLQCTAVELRIHLQTHKNQNEYKCDQCERVFKKLNHLNTHRVKHLKEFPYKCDKCSKGFVIKMNYECHILTHDTNQELPHECRQCLKRFSNPEHLNRHMVIHTENVSYSVKYKVCKCHHCLKTFKDRFDLKSHICVPVEHAVNTRFPCKICNKVFKNSSGLYNHNRNIHKLKGAKVLCSVCGNHVSNIYNHMMRHTGEKPFQCNQCGKRFVGKPQLRQHLLVHSGLKPFVCSVCAKAFNNLYNLQVHERIHKGDRCHVCSICNKGFLEKSYLKKHMNVHAKLRDSV